ncbi:XRE family transcriptional regulator [Halomonas sp. HP20-15]|uniref:XRE family transcriptional regulator n=1 Tax=Halomonas sp. HP20-15 TaxID=3085901 RepID=UPI002981DB68|nr:XRE family transcriptional regulator [Halomonas sp. HP20-15]MDW5377787.1 XRE family transcriptional regulator [Halomonas sp. HP20-15]
MDAVRQTGNCASRAQCHPNRDFDVRDMEHRTRLMRVVTRRIALSELGNREIARRAGIPTQRISDLLAGRLEHFSADDLQAIRDRVESVVDDSEPAPSVATVRTTPP